MQALICATSSLLLSWSPVLLAFFRLFFPTLQIIFPTTTASEWCSALGNYRIFPYSIINADAAGTTSIIFPVPSSHVPWQRIPRLVGASDLLLAFWWRIVPCCYTSIGIMRQVTAFCFIPWACQILRKLGSLSDMLLNSRGWSLNVPRCVIKYVFRNYTVTRPLCNQATRSGLFQAIIGAFLFKNYQ